MADTAEQTQYDTELAAVNKLTGMEKVRAKEALDAKYPQGRPGGASTASTAEIAAGLKASTSLNFGIGEALLNDPTYGAELKKVFELYKTNKTAAIDALFKTKFAKLDSDARARYVTKLENSDLYKQGLKSWVTGIKRQLKQQGSTLTDQQLEDYYMRGIDEITILDEALTGTKFEPGKTGGSQADLYNQILRTATANGISTNLLPKVLGFDTIDQVIKELQTGASLDDFNQKIRNYAKAAVPEWAKKLTGVQRVRAKEAFDAKYPDGRPANAPMSNADIASGLKIATNLGIGEALLNDPTYGEELRKVFELYKTNKTAAVDALFKSRFAKLDSDARSRYVTKLENSDLYKEGLKSWLIGVKRNLKQQGSTLTDQQLEDYYMRGIDEITILDEALTGTKFEPGKTGGSQADLYNQILRTATANGISTTLLPKVLGFDSIDQVIKELQTGASLDDFNQKIRNYAKAAVPEWAKKLIDQGSDLTDIISPYRATMADELELPYTSIDVTDSVVQNALSSNMSLADMRKQLRQDTRWQYTDRAKESVSTAALKVLRDFGFQG